jgi:hypothetical protein
MAPNSASAAKNLQIAFNAARGRAHGDDRGNLKSRVVTDELFKLASIRYLIE